MPHTELPGGLTHHLPQANHPVLLHQGLAWGIRPLTLFTLHFLSFPSTTQIFPSQYPVYSSLTAPKIQLPVFPTPHSLMCLLLPEGLRAEQWPRGWRLLLCRLPQPCQCCSLQPPRAAGAGQALTAAVAAAQVQPLLLWVHLKRCSSGSHLLSFCQPLVWLLFIGTPASSF